jgi:predicted amidophosphoribosyltransferase
MDQLQQLKQMTSVNMYIDAYEPWMTQMKRERDYLPQDFFAERFVSGLKESIRHNVQC